MKKNYFELVTDEEIIKFMKNFSDETIDKYEIKIYKDNLPKRDMCKVVYFYSDNEYKTKCVLKDTTAFFMDGAITNPKQCVVDRHWKKYLYSKFGEKYKNFLCKDTIKHIYDYEWKFSELMEVDSLSK